MTLQDEKFEAGERTLADTLGQDSDLAALPYVVNERWDDASPGHVTKIDPGKLLLRMARLYSGVRARRTAFDFSLAEPLPSPVADEALLKGLLGRSICQAMDSIGDGWGTITLSAGVLGEAPGPLFEGDLRAGLSGDAYVYLEVHDTGGFPAGLDLSPVREPFRSPCYQGTPISLSEARKLLEAQGGRILLESGSPGGTAVVFLLPYGRR